MYTLKMYLLIFHKNNLHFTFLTLCLCFLVKNGDKIVKLNVYFISFNVCRYIFDF